VQTRGYRGAHILRHLLVIWDGALIHRGRVITEFPAMGAPGCVYVKALLTCTSEMHPVEEI
jgi:hypothetical protein